MDYYEDYDGPDYEEDDTAAENMAELCNGELCEHGRCDKPAVTQITGSYREYYGAAQQTWSSFLCTEHAGIGSGVR